MTFWPVPRTCVSLHLSASPTRTQGDSGVKAALLSLITTSTVSWPPGSFLLVPISPSQHSREDSDSTFSLSEVFFYFTDTPPFPPPLSKNKNSIKSQIEKKGNETTFTSIHFTSCSRQIKWLVRYWNVIFNTYGTLSIALIAC